MLSIGWTEMMVVAAFALIVVGPKDLPALLRQIGKFAGSVRRMGNDFKAELNKVTAVDELKDIKRSIAAPLTETRKKIEQEFNSIAPNGTVNPSGKITPKDPDAQSVVDEIKNAAGIETGIKSVPETSGDAAKASIAAAVTAATRKAEEAAASDAASDVSAKGATPVNDVAPKPRRKRAARTKPASTAAKIPVTKKPPVKKTTARKKPAVKKPLKSETS